MIKKYHYLYKITNNLNGKIYIGVHTTDNTDDGYMGSGKLIQLAIAKHGVENFTKEVLQTFDSTADMYEAESILVNEEFVKDRNTYNVAIGGKGGFYKVDDDGNVIHIKCSYDNTWREKVVKGIKKHHDEHGYWWTGRHLSEEHKIKIGKANSTKQAGPNNSNYGKMWISNNETHTSTRIPKTTRIPEGWVVGRNNWNRLHAEQTVKSNRDKREECRATKLAEAERLYTLYANNNFSTIAEFVNSDIYDNSYSYGDVIRLFSKYITK